MGRLAAGDRAPDFDLASTEDAVLMLRDEVPRSPVLLFFFGDPEAADVRRDLAALAARCDEWARHGLKVLGISPAKLDGLKAVQRELALPFPLLTDDRGFAAAYGRALDRSRPARSRHSTLRRSGRSLMVLRST